MYLCPDLELLSIHHETNERTTTAATGACRNRKSEKHEIIIINHRHLLINNQFQSNHHEQRQPHDDGNGNDNHLTESIPTETRIRFPILALNYATIHASPNRARTPGTTPGNSPMGPVPDSGVSFTMSNHFRHVSICHSNSKYTKYSTKRL